ncbi:glycosyltransferase family 87 protein [Methylobacterium sp. A52T]
MPAPIETRVPGSPTARAAALRSDLVDLLSSDARLFALSRRAAWVLVPLGLAMVLLVYGTGPDPRRNWYGDPLGNDFVQVWVAGRSALEGRGADPYDLPVHLANLKAACGQACRFAWHYPPVFLLPAAAMALLDLQPAYLLWTALSLALFALAMRVAAGRRDAALVALAHPLVLCNLVYGQNGLFTASLLTLGAVLVDRRPWLAGLCFGLLAYKPHFAALAPLLLLVTGRHACLAACASTVLALCLASLALFGTAPWTGFLGTLGDTNRIILQNAAASLNLNASAFGAVRLLGGSMAAAWTAQGLVAVLALGLALRAWSRPTDPTLRAAALLVSAPLLSPYLPVYDLAPLVPAVLLLALAAHRAGGLRARERALLCAVPLFAVVREAAALTGFPLGLVLSVATFACIAARIVPRSVTLDRRRSGTVGAGALTEPAAAGSGRAA